MKFTAPCSWSPEDRMVVRSIGQYVHFYMTYATGKTVSVFLAPAALEQLDEAINAHLAEFRKPVPAPEKTTPASYSALSDQAKLVYRHMERAGSISARDAMDDHGMTSATLARRICDIEAEGFKVWRDRRVHPMTGKRYTRYSLMEANTHANAA